jgi:hypothetical protein
MVTVRPEVEALRTPPTAPATTTEEGNVVVSPATKRIAYAYERFRNILEPDEEDILRRNAIYRILERRLPDQYLPLRTAHTLIQELLRANYVRQADEAVVQLVAHEIERAYYIVPRLRGKVRTWFLHLVAVAIDRIFYPHQEAEALVRLMYADATERVIWADALVEEGQRATQLYISCHRALFAYDDYELAYHYFKHRYAAADAAHVAKDIPKLYKDLQEIIHHPARNRLLRLLRPSAVPYRLLRDVLGNPEALHDATSLGTAVAEAVKERARRIRVSINRRVWHSVLFLLLTKTTIAAVIEVPYELLVLHQFLWLPLFINVGFHPLLLLVLATSVRPPGQRNTDAIADQIEKIVTGEPLPTLLISATRRYGALTWAFFSLMYVVLFLGIFWALFTVLQFLSFSLVAMFVFIVFLGLVSFLATRIRRAYIQLRLVPRREGAIAASFSFLSLPILEFGRWLTEHLSQVNVALFLMDRILEAPFKLLIDVIEEWFAFVRDRREEIV